jgi:hypothetical protein
VHLVWGEMRISNKAIQAELAIAFPKLTFDVFGNTGSGMRTIDIVLVADEDGEVEDLASNDIARVYPSLKKIRIEGQSYSAATPRLIAFAIAQYSDLRNR